MIGSGPGTRGRGPTFWGPKKFLENFHARLQRLRSGQNNMLVQKILTSLIGPASRIAMTPASGGDPGDRPTPMPS